MTEAYRHFDNVWWKRQLKKKLWKSLNCFFFRKMSCPTLSLFCCHRGVIQFAINSGFIRHFTHPWCTMYTQNEFGVPCLCAWQSGCKFNEGWTHSLRWPCFTSALKQSSELTVNMSRHCAGINSNHIPCGYWHTSQHDPALRCKAALHVE